MKLFNPTVTLALDLIILILLQVLTTQNEYKDNVVSEVVGIVSEDSNPDVVASTVKAFVVAKLHHAVISLLERLLLRRRGTFSENRNLQHLLLVTAIRAAPEKVKDFLHPDSHSYAPLTHSPPLTHSLFTLTATLR